MVYLVPEDSTEYWVDNWVIPTDAEHPVAAHKWIDYVLDPDAAGKEMNYHQYAVPVNRHPGRRPRARQGPDHQHRRATRSRSTRRSCRRPRASQQRDRAYTEFKAA